MPRIFAATLYGTGFRYRFVVQRDSKMLRGFCSDEPVRTYFRKKYLKKDGALTYLLEVLSSNLKTCVVSHQIFVTCTSDESMLLKSKLAQCFCCVLILYILRHWTSTALRYLKAALPITPNPCRRQWGCAGVRRAQWLPLEWENKSLYSNDVLNANDAPEPTPAVTARCRQRSCSRPLQVLLDLSSIASISGYLGPQEAS